MVRRFREWAGYGPRPSLRNTKARTRTAGIDPFAQLQKEEIEMNEAYVFVLQDSGLASAVHATTERDAGLFSLLNALAATDSESYSGTTPAEAYAFVESRLRALAINPWFLTQYLRTVAERVSRHSRGY